MTQEDVDVAFREYSEAMRRLETQVKLTAYHTQRCVEAVDDTCNHVKLVVWHVREYLNKL